jgi:hypothetical protein
VTSIGVAGACTPNGGLRVNTTTTLITEALIQYTPLMISNNKRQYEPPGQESETWDTEAMAIMGGGVC